MASLSQESPKRWRILFRDLGGTEKRKQIRLYNVTKKQAEGHFRHIESIISTRLQGVQLTEVDAVWLGGLPPPCMLALYAGLAEPRMEPEAEPAAQVPAEGLSR
ncbi:MAG: hypothetical protein R3C19_05135 [Planctomycetaceae bacterium]